MQCLLDGMDTYPFRSGLKDILGLDHDVNETDVLAHYQTKAACHNDWESTFPVQLRGHQYASYHL